MQTQNILNNFPKKRKRKSGEGCRLFFGTAKDKDD
jgi:hypothetical protein